MKKRDLFSWGSVLLSLLWVITLSTGLCTKAGAAETLNLGATVPFQSRIGIELKNILEMNADLLNKAGGLTVAGKTYMIKYHIYDDQYKADAGRSAIERLVFEDKIEFNVGTFGSAPTLAMLPVTEPNKIPIFGGAASEKLLEPNVKYFVHTYLAKSSFGYAEALREIRPDIKNILLFTYDDETGHALVPPISKAYEFFGIKPLPPLYFKHGETDFSHLATKAVAMKPDYISSFATVLEAENVQMIKAIRTAGYKGALECRYISPPMLDNIVAKIGKESVEGMFVGIYDPTLPDLKNRPQAAMEFRKNYEKYYGKWETQGLQWAACWYAWLGAVKKADSIDPDRVMAAIDKDFTVETPDGVGKFFTRPDLGNDKYRDYWTVIRGGVVKDGKITFLFERDADYGINILEKVYKAKMR